MRDAPYLIGIAGPSGAGKSFLAAHLAEPLKAPVLALDHYYRDLSHLAFEQRLLTNFDKPSALEHELLISQVNQLQLSNVVAVPTYDFSQHTRTSKPTLLEPAPFIILEGLFTLCWPDLRNLLGTGVYVETDENECFARRLDRDVHERGRTPESVVRQYRETVVPMAVRYVLPTRQRADVVVSGTEAIEENVARILHHVRKRLAQVEAEDRAIPLKG